jgi:hypothetical protein
MLIRAIVHFSVMTNIGETRTLWNHSLMVMNVRASHLREICCTNKYNRDMQTLGVIGTEDIFE